MERKALYAEELDTLECNNPMCDHTAHGGHEMYLHQSCHTGYGVTAMLDQDMLVVVCAYCGMPVVAVFIEGPIPEKPTCHPGAPWYIAYKDRHVTFYCSECATPHGQVRVKSYV